MHRIDGRRTWVQAASVDLPPRPLNTCTTAPIAAAVETSIRLEMALDSTGSLNSETESLSSDLAYCSLYTSGDGAVCIASGESRLSALAAAFKIGVPASTRGFATWEFACTLAFVLCPLSREKALDADLDFTAASKSMDWLGIM